MPKGGDANASNSSLLIASTVDSATDSPSRLEQPCPLNDTDAVTPVDPDGAVPTSHAQSPAAALFAKSNSSPATAFFRPTSRNSGQSSPTRTHLNLRGRSSTMSSLGRASPRPSVDEHLGTAGERGRRPRRAGRASGDLLGLSRTRQASEASGRHGSLTPATPRLKHRPRTTR